MIFYFFPLFQIKANFKKKKKNAQEYIYFIGKVHKPELKMDNYIRKDDMVQS